MCVDVVIVGVGVVVVVIVVVVNLVDVARLVATDHIILSCGQ